MVSSFYTSNQKKLKYFQDENKIREKNQSDQQDIVDSQAAKELGLEYRAEKLSKLAKRVFDKVGSDFTSSYQQGLLTSQKQTPFKLLTNAINNNGLTKLFDKLKALPPSSLNKTQRLIQQDLSNPEFKTLMNESISQAYANGPEAIATTVLNILGGEGNEKEVEKMIDMSSDEEKTKTVLSLPKEKTKLKRGKVKVSDIPNIIDELTTQLVNAKDEDKDKIKKRINNLTKKLTESKK